MKIARGVLIVVFGLFLASFSLPSVFAENICVLSSGECINSTTGTEGNNYGWNGEAIDYETTCKVDKGGLFTVSDSASFYGPTAILSCGVRCCCSPQGASVTTPTIPANRAACEAGFTPTSEAYNPTGLDCNTKCSGTPPLVASNCQVDQTVGTACICNSVLIPTGSMCCSTGGIAGPGQTCEGIDPPDEIDKCPTCDPATSCNRISEDCTCGTIIATTPDYNKVCCANGQIALNAAACPVDVPESSLCGNNILNGNEQCDAPGVLPTPVPPTLPICPKKSTPSGMVDQTCTAQCTCIPSSTIDCNDGICSANENQVCGVNGRPGNDCPNLDACQDPAGLTGVQGLTATLGVNGVTLRWTLPTACEAEKIVVARSTEGLVAVRTRPQYTTTIDTGVPATLTSYTDSPLPPLGNTSLYYSVNLVFADGSTRNVSVQVNVPTLACPYGAITYCKNATTMVQCDDTYGSREVTCTGNYICTAINNNQDATCLLAATASSCSNCNGLYGMFRDDQAQITEGNLVGGTRSITCMLSNTCYADLRSTAVQTYSSCASINSCAGYRTESACLANQCRKPTGTANNQCVWNVYDPQINKGVCAPTGTTFVPLACSDCAFAAGGVCDQVTCEAIGRISTNGSSMCGFISNNVQSIWNQLQHPTSAIPGCVPSTELPCEYLFDQNSCEGGSLYTADVSYTSTRIRDGITNTVLTRSNDVAGHGKCVWMTGPSGGICRKDSDKNNVADLVQYQGNLNAWKLSLDFDPPTSTLLAIAGSQFGRQLRIPFVTDGQMFACITRAGSTCYPNNQSLIVGSGNNTQIWYTFRPGDDGDWSIFYYAQDNSFNLERVRQFDFKVDTMGPNITVNPLVNTTIRITLTGTPQYRQRFDVSFSTDEFAICSTRLQDNFGTDIPATDRGTTANTDLRNATGQLFSLTYPGLIEGSFVLKITCFDRIGNPSNTSVTIISDLDGSIFGPSPVNPNATKATNVTISIKTTTPAICAYGPWGTPYSQMTRYSTTGGTLHVSSVSVPGSGQYTYATACDFGNGRIVNGGLSDLIIFSVDVDGPITSICDANNSVSCATPDVTVPVVSFRIRFECNDIPPTGSSPNFGCKEIRACSVLKGASPCNPGVIQNGVLTPLDGTKDWTVYYYSVDNGGNIEPTRNFNTNAIDLTPPRAPMFTLIG